MASVGRLDERYRFVFEQRGARLRQHTDEGIVEGVDDQRGDGDLRGDAGARSATVVVVRAGEAAVACGDLFVEFADGPHEAYGFRLVDLREELGLALETPHEVAQKMPLVDAVGALVQGVGAGCEICGWADADGREQPFRSRSAEFAGQLEHQIAAHGVSNHGYAAQAVGRCKMVQDRAHIRGQAGVVERWGPVFCAAAVAHVHANDVAAGSPGECRDSADVLRIGGAFEAVDEQDGQAVWTKVFRLPVAMAKHAAAVGGVDRHFNCRGGNGKRLPAPVVSSQRLRVAASQPRGRLEGSQPVRAGRRAGGNTLFLRADRQTGDERIRHPEELARRRRIFGDFNRISGGGLGRLVGIEPTTSCATDRRSAPEL